VISNKKFPIETLSQARWRIKMHFHDLRTILTKFEKLVSPIYCNALARECGLVQRSTSKLQGYEFAQAMLIPNAFLDAETLNSLATRMYKSNEACNLSASALAQRINSKPAEVFMRRLYEKTLQELVKRKSRELSDLPNLVGLFNRVLIEDSTMAELHEKLGAYFRGSGGVASKSSVKIDVIFDYLSETIVDIEFFSGNIPDQSLASRINAYLEKDDLVVRDLGYYILERIKEIAQAGAYYISRIKTSVAVYENKEATKPLDLAKFLDQRCEKGIIDTVVFIGKEKHPTRLVACLMSDAAVNKRRRDAHKTAQRHGSQLGKKKSSLLKYCIFITNIPVTMLRSTEVMATYRARWRIELIFKQWKSCLKLHVFKGYNKERFHCMLYGRLIMIVLLGSISPPLMQYALTLRRELSCFKLLKYLIADHAFPRAVLEGTIEGFINTLVQDIPRRLCMDKRKRLSLRENVKMSNSYYNPLEMKEVTDAIAA
jgi:Transposase DDE domain.